MQQAQACGVSDSLAASVIRRASSQAVELMYTEVCVGLEAMSCL